MSKAEEKTTQHSAARQVASPGSERTDMCGRRTRTEALAGWEGGA